MLVLVALVEGVDHLQANREYQRASAGLEPGGVLFLLGHLGDEGVHFHVLGSY